MAKKAHLKFKVPTDPLDGVYFSPEQVLSIQDWRRDRATFPSDTVAQDRIRRVFDHASEDELQKGIEWYRAAGNMCLQMYQSHPERIQTPAHGAGIVAALSPRNSWRENIERANLLIDTGETYGLGYVVRDARAILEGLDPYDVLFDPARSNFKVRAFFLNMAEADTSSAVTIDRHGWAMIFDDRSIGDLILRYSADQYDWASDMFRCVAKEVEMPAHEVQAVTWLVWRKKKTSISFADELRLF